jgi:ubiquinone/menaquinone biosynthesis C-methylase UbiE
MENTDWDSYAENYHTHIVSPFQKEIKNPLYDDLQNSSTDNLVVADMGTGIGDFLPFLAERFKQVYAVDFSEAMLGKAKERFAYYSNIKFFLADIRNVSELGLMCDVVVAVNSIIQPNLNDVNRSLNEIYKSLKKGGVFMGIFPSMDSVLMHSVKVYEREFLKCEDNSEAMNRTKKIIERNKYNFITGIYSDNGEDQKFFYKFELKSRLRVAGFKKIKFRKIFYPLGTDICEYEYVKGIRGIWDWYIVAQK